MRIVSFADLPGLVGEDLGRSDWLQITQDRVDAFADATGDDQWIHVDVARATREIGGPIAHGFLISALVPLLARGMFRVEGQARTINYGVDRIRFVNQVKVGARIRMRSRLLHAEAKSGGVLAKLEHTIDLEGGAKPACVAETISLYLPA